MTSNIPPSIRAKIGKNLHQNNSHPVGIIKNHIYKYFDALNRNFAKFDDIDPIVPAVSNFYQLLIPLK